MTIDLERYRALYLEEARENVAAFASALDAEPPYARPVIDELFRRAHSIKGMSAAMGVDPIRDLSHAVEDVLGGCRAGTAELDHVHRDALRASADYLARQLDAYEEHREIPASTPARAALAATLAAADGKPGPDRPQTPGEATTRPRAAEGVVKVAAAELDRLQEWTTDLSLTLANLVSSLPGEVDAEVATAVSTLTRTCRQLHETTLRMRLARLDGLAPQLGRAARETAAHLGKRAELTFDAGDVAVDRAILEALSDPLLHLVRNAIDHGVESPSERADRGKPAVGRLVLTACRDDDTVRIELGDDGRGIDRDALRLKAEKLGLHPVSDHELLLLTTMPGLSTRSEVSDVSGRGVGLDLVRARIESLGGRIDLTSHAGQGTVVTLRAPLTLARQRLLLVRLGDVTYAVPRARVQRVMLTPPGDAPVLHVGERLGIPGGDGFSLIVVDSAGAEHRLGIDEVLSELELVVRPLGRPLQRLRVFSGAALLPRGEIALVLDPEAIVHAETPQLLASMSFT